MIKHIVMFKLKEWAEGGDRSTNIKALKAKLEALPAQIGEIKSFEVGLNFIEANVAYDLVLVSEFESKEALYRYQKHPEHLQLANFVGKVCESRIVVDYVL
ncbi:MAG: Dabb family protein [Methanothrix sp.]|nr:Dabb family protein [Methanothrix sp.]